MAVPNPAGRIDTLAKMAESRAEIRRILEPRPRPARGDAEPIAGETIRDDVFPRSRTMRLLTSGRGLGTAGAMIGGLALARPAMAFRMLRMLPTGAVARMLLVKAFTAFRARRS